MRGFLLSLQFLTVLPVHMRGEVTEEDVARSALFFPLTGALQGTAASLCALLLTQIFPEEITGGIIILILVLFNGGFHIDGLADTADALAVKSTGDVQRDKEKRLTVMKDSATGAAGVTAIVMSILLKYLFLSHLHRTCNLITVCASVILMGALSRWSLVPAMYHGEAARVEGLGKIFLDRTGIKTILASSVIMGIVFISVKELLLPHLSRNEGLLLLSFLILFLYFFGLLSVRVLTRKFGGLTGDTFGAISEVSEIVFLSIVTVWLRFR